MRKQVDWNSKIEIEEQEHNYEVFFKGFSIGYVENPTKENILGNSIDDYTDINHKLDVARKLQADKILYTLTELKRDLDNPDSYYEEISNSKKLSRYLNTLLASVDWDDLICLDDSDISTDADGTFQYNSRDYDCQDQDNNTVGTNVFELLFSLCGEFAKSQDIRKIAVLSGMKYIYDDNGDFYFWKSEFIND